MHKCKRSPEGGDYCIIVLSPLLTCTQDGHQSEEGGHREEHGAWHREQEQVESVRGEREQSVTEAVVLD